MMGLRGFTKLARSGARYVLPLLLGLVVAWLARIFGVGRGFAATIGLGSSVLAYAIVRFREIRRRWRKYRLPVIADRVVASPPLERKLAEQGVLPKRCGLCKHFSREVFEQVAQTNPAWAEAMAYIPPAQMGARKGAPPQYLSEQAYELRPLLREQWSDYGTCLRFVDEDGQHESIWGFWEQPEMPAEQYGRGEQRRGSKRRKPCGEWS